MAGPLKSCVYYIDNRSVLVTAFGRIENILGPYVAASGANYWQMPVDYTVPNDRVIYFPWCQIGPVQESDHDIQINWKIYANNVEIIQGMGSNSPIPLRLYGPPGVILRVYTRVMATEVGITPAIQLSFPNIEFDPDNDNWEWDVVAGVANPPLASGLPTWP